MTSKLGAKECFVYLTLPGETDFVTAGKFVLEPDRAGTPVGRFVYGKSYLERQEAVPIDPVELKLGRTTYHTAALKGMQQAYEEFPRNTLNFKKLPCLFEGDKRTFG